MKSKLKLLGILAIGGVMSISSCSKEGLNEVGSLNKETSMDIDKEAFDDVADFTLAQAGFEISETNPLKKLDMGCNSEGSLIYKKGGVMNARVEFKKDGATIYIEGKADKHIAHNRAKKDSKYNKVMVEPIVKTADCNYIVSGVVKYYDQNNNWVATVDYGDGTCDAWATKIWKDGKKKFSLDK